MINKDGTVTGDLHAESILSITPLESGEIYVETEYLEEVGTSFGYIVYPPGCTTSWPENDPSKVRVKWMLNTSGYIAFLTQIS